MIQNCQCDKSSESMQIQYRFQSADLDLIGYISKPFTLTHAGASSKLRLTTSSRLNLQEAVQLASASVRYFWRQERSQESKEAEGVPSPSPSFSSSFALSPFSSRKSVKTLPEQSVSGCMAIHGDQIQMMQ